MIIERRRTRQAAAETKTATELVGRLRVNLQRGGSSAKATPYPEDKDGAGKDVDGARDTGDAPPGTWPPSAERASTRPGSSLTSKSRRESIGFVHTPKDVHLSWSASSPRGGQ